ncbi:MAG: PAS domain S-box protein, partial [Gemmatimonadales bacterium]
FLAAIVESSEDAIISESLDGSITSWNAGAERLFGYPAAEIVGRPMDQLLPEERLDEWRNLQGRIRQGQVARMESEWLRIDGASLVVAITMSPIRDHQGAILGASIIARDMTERTELERQLRESQKMEAVGRLAGGIAHDFNNVLTAIIGISDLLLEETPENSTTTRDLQEIRNAAGRAADLTRQLLAFSRRQNANPRRILLSEVVAGLKEMLDRLLGEDIRLEVRTAPDLGAVRMDPGQVEQILMNLVVNARDAMPDGGTITIETRNVGIGGGSGPPGRQVLLEVRDTGTGIDEATLSRIFEPFFTTKEQGKGTGLGLATVHGIVTQNEGRIMVASRPGEGTSFTILLPRLPDDTPDSAPPRTAARIAGAGCGTILVVEDEPAVRSLIVTTLQRAGCLVLAAAGAEEGLLLLHEHPGRVDLVLTDVVLRGESGKWLADRLAVTHPGLPVVYMSGYTDDMIGHHGILDPAVPFIAKPFTPATLVGRIREILDPGRRDPGHGGSGTPPGTFSA